LEICENHLTRACFGPFLKVFDGGRFSIFPRPGGSAPRLAGPTEALLSQFGARHWPCFVPDTGTFDPLRPEVFQTEPARFRIRSPAVGSSVEAREHQETGVAV
jgi:hypothetical protein